MAEAIGDYFAQKDYGKPYNSLDDLQQGIIDVKTTHEIKPNRYDAATDTLTLTAAQIEGLNRVKQHWEKIFKEGEQRYGFLPETIAEAEQRLQISRFFFWTAWVASTLRPGTDYSYTNNWPPDKRVGNTASTETYFYSIAGILALFVVLGLFVYWIHRYGLWYGEAKGGAAFWVGWGAIFSSMEPVPLITLVVRGLMEYRDIREQGREFSYKWPMYFLVAASFWNFLGAGIFGFLINLPIINFYEHGTYLTMHHGHTAMFGTYGMLSVSLLLFSWRGLVEKAYWKDGLLKLSFWGLNGGLFLMAFFTLLPVGAIQTWTAFKEGYWVARSADFFEKGSIVFLGTFRAIPDTIIIVLGVLPLAYFLISTYPHLKAAEIKDGESVWERLGVEL